MRNNPLAFTWHVIAGTCILLCLAITATLAWPDDAKPKGVQFFCDFERTPTDCGFEEQSKVPGRATLVPIARSGKFAVRLHTEPTDTQVHGSDDWARDDLSLDPKLSDCSEGKEAWWAHSVMFPDDYVVSREGGTVMDFHHMGSGGNANFHFNVTNNGN